MPKYYLKYLLKYSVIKNITKYYHTTFSHLKWKWLAQHCLCLFEVASFYFLWESLDEQLFYFWDFLPPALNHIFTKIVAGYFFLKKRIIIKNIIVWSVQGMLGSGTKSRWWTWHQNWQYESTDVKSMKLWDAGSRPITNPHIVDRGSCRLVTPGWSMSSLIITANWSIFHAPDWSFRN